ncbi:hypothetical protein PoB_004837700 [Plakobranchus ocellatus]|uniref:Uncharacterized protein n=1 Tax=Plakobranchus ocellatus TaxID=259542 RepID=A0AAV4BSB2_9GAST|nr:hypothetical protein PoB_004837700 [Plakobranchus ocellatus]
MNQQSLFDTMTMVDSNSFRMRAKGPQQNDLRLSGPQSGQSTGGWSRAYDRRVAADLRTGSLSIVPHQRGVKF